MPEEKIRNAVSNADKQTTNDAALKEKKNLLIHHFCHIKIKYFFWKTIFWKIFLQIDIFTICCTFHKLRIFFACCLTHEFRTHLHKTPGKDTAPFVPRGTCLKLVNNLQRNSSNATVYQQQILLRFWHRRKLTLEMLQCGTLDCPLPTPNQFPRPVYLRDSMIRLIPRT